jgi:PHD/YefM family antitoxin component YafN of YafNO toxin-antitoxin module
LTNIALSEQDRRLLLETRRLLDELLETLDVLSNPEELRALKESEKEMRKGKLTPLDDLIHELKTRKVQS